MSSFVVSDATMSRAVRALLGRGAYNHPVLNTFAGIELRLGVSQDLASRLGNILFSLNEEAYQQRYGGEPTAHDFVAGLKVGGPRALAEQVADLKALECLSYQCAEGDVVESALYLELQAAIGSVAAGIVSTLPEYAAAGWGG